MRHRLRAWNKPAAVLALLALLAPLAGKADEKRPAAEAPTADEVIQKMLAMDRWRLTALQRYTSHRRYVAENKRFGKRAEVEVLEQYVFPGLKTLDILSESGSSFVRRKVIDKLIAAESDSFQDENRDQTKVTPQNYTFELLGGEEQEGRPCYVIAINPKRAKKYLMRGRIWVDKKDYAIVRMEGKPAKKPSFWIRKAHIVRRYKKYGPFWLTASLDSVSSIWIVGKSSLHIDYFDYAVNTVRQKGQAGGQLSELPDRLAVEGARVPATSSRGSTPPADAPTLGFQDPVSVGGRGRF